MCSSDLGVLLKGGPVLERLSRAHTLVIDKTGTLTHGHAELSGIAVHGGHDENEVLRLAASLDQASMGEFSDPSLALAQALRNADPADRILVFGSFFTVGGVLQQGLHGRISTSS